MSVLAALTPVVEAFEMLGIAYQVGGSVASSVHGMPRSTNDVDVVADLGIEHVETLCRALQGLFYADAELLRDAVRRRSSANFIHLATGYKVDLFVCKDTEYDRLALQRSVSRSLGEGPGGRAFELASPEDVVLRKLIWYRAGDEVSNRRWSDVLGLLRIRHTSLDRDYMDDWARRLDIDDLLRRADAEVARD